MNGGSNPICSNHTFVNYNIFIFLYYDEHLPLVSWVTPNFICNSEKVTWLLWNGFSYELTLHFVTTISKETKTKSTMAAWS